MSSSVSIRCSGCVGTDGKPDNEFVAASETSLICSYLDNDNVLIIIIILKIVLIALKKRIIFLSPL